VVLRGRTEVPGPPIRLASRSMNWAIFKDLCRKTWKKSMCPPPQKTKILDPPLAIRYTAIGPYYICCGFRLISEGWPPLATLWPCRSVRGHASMHFQQGPSILDWIKCFQRVVIIIWTGIIYFIISANCDPLSLLSSHKHRVYYNMIVYIILLYYIVLPT